MEPNTHFFARTWLFAHGLDSAPIPRNARVGIIPTRRPDTLAIGEIRVPRTLIARLSKTRSHQCDPRPEIIDIEGKLPMKPEEIRILAEPQTNACCRFTVDRPVYPNSSHYFASRDAAASSPLARKLFELNGVTSLLISHDQITVNQTGQIDWRDLGKQVGAAIREQFVMGGVAISPDLRNQLPSPDQIRDRVQKVLDAEINPQVGQHGGFVRLVEVRVNNVLIEMGGGCQGCGSARRNSAQLGRSGHPRPRSGGRRHRGHDRSRFGAKPVLCGVNVIQRSPRGAAP